MTEQPLSRRERQAPRTRDEILDAARRLFAERGYTRTSVREIAEAAGVSAQTVYDSIGSKQALVARLNDLIDEEAGIAQIAMAAAQSTDPVEVVATPARITRSILEHCGDVIRALVTGASAEPELADVLETGHRRHVEGAKFVVGLLKKLGALDKRASSEEAALTLAALSDFRFALMMQESYGWSLDRVEAWMIATAQKLLLAAG